MEPQRFGFPLPSGERSAERSGGGVRGPLALSYIVGEMAAVTPALNPYFFG